MDKIIEGQMLPFPMKYSIVTSKKAYKQFEKSMGLKKKDRFKIESHGLCTLIRPDNGVAHVCVYLDLSQEDPIVLLGLLVHETMHVVQYLIEVMEDKQPSKEFEAYMMQFFFMEFCQMLEHVGAYTIERKTDV